MHAREMHESVQHYADVGGLPVVRMAHCFFELCLRGSLSCIMLQVFKGLVIVVRVIDLDENFLEFLTFPFS